MQLMVFHNCVYAWLYVGVWPWWLFWSVFEWILTLHLVMELMVYQRVCVWVRVCVCVRVTTGRGWSRQGWMGLRRVWGFDTCEDGLSQCFFFLQGLQVVEIEPPHPHPTTLLHSWSPPQSILIALKRHNWPPNPLTPAVGHEVHHTLSALGLAANC